MSIRTLGVRSLRYVTRTGYLSGHGWPIAVKVVVFCAPFTIIRFLNSLGVGPGTFNIFPVNALMLIALMVLCLPFIPPTAVVFSSSTDRQLRWALSLKQIAGGRRVISLLDTGYLKSKRSIHDLWNTFTCHAITLMDVLRTLEAENWQFVVQELVKIAPIVIVDTRVCTQALLFEAATVASSEYAHKAIFISEDDGSCPVLERLVVNGSVPSDLLISIVKEGELRPILSKLIKSPRSLPQFGSFPAPPVAIGECVRGELQPESASDRGELLDPGIEETEFPEDKRRLSTRWTLVLRLAALVFWITVLMTFVFGPELIEQTPAYMIPKFSGTVWAVLLSAAFLIGFAGLYELGRLREVFVHDDYLLVTDYKKKIKIPIFDIAHVSGPDWTRMMRITIHLQTPSGFGRRIVFVPSLSKADEIVRDLRRHSTEAARSANTKSLLS